MTQVGPVCHIPPTTTGDINPLPKDIPGLPPGAPVPPVIQRGLPDANSLNDYLRNLSLTINQIIQVLRMLANQQQTYGKKGGGGGGKPEKKPQWNETSRAVQVVRVFNPQDHEQYVDVEQINSLVLTDKNTGAQWKWKR